MRRIRRLVALPAAEKWLLIKALVLVWLVRLALWILPFSWTKSILGRWNNNPPSRLAAKRLPAERIAWAVTRSSRLVPGARHCLTQALAAHSLLLRRGYPTSSHIGVARDEAGKLIAHAWVECEGVVLVGGDQDLAKYTKLDQGGN